MIKLGDKITLEGFENLEPGNITILKKMIGNFVKKISENRNFSNLTLKLKDKYEVHSELHINSKKLENKASNSNLFFCLTDLFKEIESQI
ncbi:hypothetical protein J4403_01875 [Candidatus Woesearchaeota archaeon]|nr:hypothetical protein [Candidatus Woesearchaeota archaeon]